jgi:hypothetical protein
MDILRRIRAGEDFAELARRYTEDPATQANGGELGSFARGAMLEEFERAAFSLRVGEISDLVRTKEGYHIIQCMGRETAYAQPLVWMYGNVGADAALEKGERISRTRADSLYLVAGTPAKLRAAARKLDLPVVQMTHTVGNRSGVPHLVDVLATLETLKPGELYPGPHRGVGKEYCFSWVDSFAPPPAPRWVDARERAIAVYRQGAGRRAFDAKIAELDSLERAGFGFDSLGALWGGLEQIPTLERGKGLPRLKGTQEVDSLVFGGAQPPALAPGRTSAWLDLPSAKLRVRLDQRIGPTASELATRVEAIHRSEMDRKLYGYFMDLKRRDPVRILDPELRDVGLPEPRER